MSTLLFGAGGGEIGDSCSISLPCLFVGDFTFRLDFGVIGSSSSLASSLVFLFSFWLRSAARHSSVEWPFAVVEGAVFSEVICRRLLRRVIY